MDICNVYIHANATHKIGLINITPVLEGGRAVQVFLHARLHVRLILGVSEHPPYPKVTALRMRIESPGGC